MAKPYSEDLRDRVVAAVEGGLSRREVARRFRVGISTVIEWVRRFRRPEALRRSRWAGL